MIFDVYSDTHLDSWVYKGFDPVLKPSPNARAAIFAGDAGNGFEWYSKMITMLDQAYEQGCIAVPGNHEYYYHQKYTPGLASPIHYDASNQLYKKYGLKILTSTLWTNFWGREVLNPLLSKNLNDFKCIPGMTPQIMQKMGRKAHNFLYEFVGEDIDIVVTHFAPLRNSMHPKYAHHHPEENSYYYNDYGLLVQDLKPKYWVHGHTHMCMDYDYEGTQVIANPIGYCGECQSSAVFEPMTIEV